MTKDKIKEILDLLNTLQEQLLSVPDDMHLNIDPRDNESLQNGYSAIKEFNDTLADYTEHSVKLAGIIKNHFDINPEIEDVETGSDDRRRRDRIVKELDTTAPHTLDEDFTYKRPYGFILGESAYKGLKTWKNLYINVLHILREKDARRFSTLKQAEEFISSQGNPQFSETEDPLRVGEKVTDGFFAEINLSANNLRNNIKALLEYFKIDPQEMKIYLREDRDAG